jgi:hypothetical protein
MLRTAHILCAVAVLAFGFDAHSQEPASSSQAPREQAAQPTTPDQRGTDQIPLTVKILPAPDSQEKTAKEERDRREKAEIDKRIADETARLATYTDQLATYTYWTAAFTFCVFLGTVLLGAGTFMAALAAKQAADHIPHVERAYIFIETELGYSHRPAVTYAWWNHGKTSAVVKGLEAHFDVSAIAPNNVPFKANIPIRDEYVMPPADKWTPVHLVRDLTGIQQSDIAASKEFLWFYGSLLYQDVFGKEHVTRFRWRYNPEDKSFAAFGGPPYNERT